MAGLGLCHPLQASIAARPSLGRHRLAQIAIRCSRVRSCSPGVAALLNQCSSWMIGLCIVAGTDFGRGREGLLWPRKGPHARPECPPRAEGPVLARVQHVCNVDATGILANLQAVGLQLSRALSFLPLCQHCHRSSAALHSPLQL